MNQTVNKDVLIDILLQENQELKKLHADYRNTYQDYAATLEQVKTKFSQSEKTLDKLKLAYEDKIQVLEHLVQAQNKEIQELHNRIRDLKAALANPLSEEAFKQ